MIACDTSFPVSRFVRGANHERATELVMATDEPVYLSHLNRLEFETVAWRIVGGGHLTAAAFRV